MHKINFNIQRLYKQRKRKILSISFLVILILFCLSILIYDFIKIKELALKEKQLKRIQSWMIEKIEDTYININKDNQDCNFTNKWVKN